MMLIVTALETQVHIEVHVQISFGLEIFADIFVDLLASLEVIMNNSFAIFMQVMASVWCGIAFLRRLSGERKFQPKRGICVYE